MEIILDKNKSEIWWTTFGRGIEEEIEEVQNYLNISENQREEKLGNLWLEYRVSSRVAFQT
jgi:hypothetical protein